MNTKAKFYAILSVVFAVLSLGTFMLTGQRELTGALLMFTGFSLWISTQST